MDFLLIIHSVESQKFEVVLQNSHFDNMCKGLYIYKDNAQMWTNRILHIKGLNSFKCIQALQFSDGQSKFQVNNEY